MKLEKIAKRLSGYQPHPSLLRLNLGDAENGVPGNQRDDYGDFPCEWALKVASPDYLPSDEDKVEIKALLDAADPMDDKTMSWLVKSIVKHGVQEPIRGYKLGDEIIVTEGNRRTVACNIAIKVFDVQIHSVPMLVEQAEKGEKGINPATALIRQYVANQGKKEFSPVEEAKVFESLLNLGMKEPDIAEQLSTPVAKIRQRLQLLILPPAGQDFVKELEIAPAVAIAAIKEAAQITENPMSVGVVATQILKAAAEPAQGKPSKVTGALVRQAAAVKKSEKLAQGYATAEDAEAAALIEIEQDKEQRQQAEENIEAALPLVESQKVLCKAAATLLDEGLDIDTLRSVVGMLSAASSAKTEALSKAAKMLGRAI